MNVCPKRRYRRRWILPCSLTLTPSDQGLRQRRRTRPPVLRRRRLCPASTARLTPGPVSAFPGSGSSGRSAPGYARCRGPRRCLFILRRLRLESCWCRCRPTAPGTLVGGVGQQGAGVRQHHRVVVHVHDARLRGDPLGNLMGVFHRRQSGAVEELADARLGGQVVDDLDKELPGLLGKVEDHNLDPLRGAANPPARREPRATSRSRSVLSVACSRGRTGCGTCTFRRCATSHVNSGLTPVASCGCEWPTPGRCRATTCRQRLRPS